MDVPFSNFTWRLLPGNPAFWLGNLVVVDRQTHIPYSPPYNVLLPPPTLTPLIIWEPGTVTVEPVRSEAQIVRFFRIRSLFEFRPAGAKSNANRPRQYSQQIAAAPPSVHRAATVPRVPSISAPPFAS
jgi:hypothetical protein